MKNTDTKKSKIIILLSLIFVLILFIKISFISCNVVTESMSPTIISGKKVLAIKKKLTNIDRNDIIIFSTENLNMEELGLEIDSLYFVKRVIAKENDLVQIRNNQLFVNNTFIKNVGNNNSKNLDILLKDNQFFVMGDNITNSLDSRNYGLVDYNDIVGKVIHIHKK